MLPNMMPMAGGGGAGLGLNNLKQPTRMQPVGGPARPVVGPNPLANGGQGPKMPPTHPLAPSNFGGLTNPLSPVTGMSPGGPTINPADLGDRVMPRPQMPQMSPPGLLDGGPGIPQRSLGFGGIRPISQY